MEVPAQTSTTYLKRLSRFRKVSAFLSFVVFLVGAGFFLAWRIQPEALASAHPVLLLGPLTSLSFLMIGASILLWPLEEDENRLLRKWLARIFAFIPTLIAISSFSHCYLNFSPPQILSIVTGACQRVSFVPVVDLICFGFALTVLDWRPKGYHIGQFFVMTVGATSLLGLLDYFYVSSDLADVSFTRMTLPTSLCFFFLSVAALCKRCESGVMKSVVLDSPGGRMNRRLMISVIVVPLILGWLRLQIQAEGVMTQHLGVSVIIVSLIVFLTVMVWTNARSIDLVDAQRVQTNAALQKQTVLLQSILNTMREGVIVVDKNGRHLLFNPAAVDMSGFRSLNLYLEDRVQRYGLYRTDGVTPADANNLPLQRALEGEEVNDFELCIRNQSHPEGIWTNANARPLRDEEGRIQGAALVLHDVTDKRRAEIELRESELRYRSVAQSYESLLQAQSDVGQGVFLADFTPKGVKFAYVNDAFCKMSGYSREELLDLPSVFELTTPDQRETVIGLSRKLLTGHKVPEYYETMLQHKNGSTIHVDLSVKKMRAPVEGRFLVLIRNITRRKLAESALKESEERFRLLVSGVKDYAIVMLSPRGDIVSWNSGAEKVFGFSSDEILGRHFSILHGQDESENNETHRDLRTAIEKGKFEEEGIKLRRDKSAFWANTHIAPLYDAEKNLYGFAQITRDITERKKAEEERKRREELERSNRELEQFAYISSHDLQEPLRMVSSFAQLLDKRCQNLDDSSREYISYIVKGARRMHDLIQDLLAFSRLSMGVLPAENVDCNHALAVALENLKVQITSNSAQIHSDTLPKIKGHPTQLVQLFQNLIGNALKFKSEEPPRVTVSCTQQGDYWLFSVSDNGIGFEQKYAQQIFTVFRRLHSRDEYPGTGIGLASCKKVIEQHGGSIWAESHIGRGSIFFFTLPKAITNELNLVRTNSGA